MIYDIAAAQALYGANRTDTSNTTYTLNNGTTQARTIWDAGGTADHFTVSGSTANAVLDLRGGIDPTTDKPYWSNYGTDYVAIAFDPQNTSKVVDIEKATGGAGNDKIYGGVIDNILSGGSAGTDTLIGGTGVDTYVIQTSGARDLRIDDVDGFVNLQMPDSYFGVGTRTIGGKPTLCYFKDVDHSTGIALQYDSATSSIGIFHLTFTGTFNIGVKYGQILNVAADLPFSIPLDPPPFPVNDWNIEVAFTRVTSQTGDSSANEINGGSSADSLAGAAGDDSLFGALGNDTLNGGNDNDYLDGGQGNDSMVGGTGNDRYVVDSASDVVVENASEGTDTVKSSISYTLGSNVENLSLLDVSAALTATGNSVANVLTGNSYNNTLVGAAGADTIYGGYGFDTVSYASASAAVSINLATNSNGGSDAAGDMLYGIEAVIGTAYADTLTGGDADDYFIGGAGSDAINGGNGIDTLSFETSSTWISGNLGTNSFFNGDASWDSVSNVENLIGSAYADYLGGTSTANRLEGGNGNDSIEGFGGNDTLVGGSGDDLLFGGDGDDLIIGGPGSDYIDGGNGSDTLSFATATSWVSGDLAANNFWNSDASWDNVMTNVENLTGSDYADYLNGSTAANVLTGGLGNDSIVGGDGNDTVIGGAGDDNLSGSNNDDLIIGGAGSDYVDGGAGNDTLSFETSSTWVSADIAGNSYWNGDAAWDNVTNVENLRGSDHADYLYGSAIANVLTGGAGNDYLEGRAGNDTLYGGTGNDIFAYGTGSGADTISGFEGAGAAGGDTIQLSSSIYATAAIALTHVSYSGGNATIDLGSGNSIHLVGVTSMVAGDFVIV
jgi:Ca2+-binding RTX toxin-like protein